MLLQVRDGGSLHGEASATMLLQGRNDGRRMQHCCFQGGANAECGCRSEQRKAPAICS